MKIHNREIVDALVSEIYRKIGIDRPDNHDEIVDFIIEDVEASADEITWHSGDVDISFRRFLESK